MMNDPTPMDVGPITMAVLTVEAVHGEDAASKLLVELIEELTRASQKRDSVRS